MFVVNEGYVLWRHEHTTLLAGVSHLLIFMNASFEFVYCIMFGLGGGAVAAKSVQRNVR